MHDPRGILAQQDTGGDWAWMVNDGLGSVRSVLDEGFDPKYSTHYAPYGDPWGAQGSDPTDFGFTGEQTDANGLVYLRARYYDPVLGVFPSLDPLEGRPSRAMSLNRYAYVGGNVVNRVDPSGMIREEPGQFDRCWQLPKKGCIELCEQFIADFPWSVRNGIYVPTDQLHSTDISNPSTNPANRSQYCSEVCEEQKNRNICDAFVIDWKCAPHNSGNRNHNCDEWLNAAKQALCDRTSGPYVRHTLDLLNDYRSGSSINNVMRFQWVSGGFAPVGGHIFLDPTYLDESISVEEHEFLSNLSVLGHELRHSEFSTSRYSIWGELDAYNFQSKLREELGLSNAVWRTELLRIGGGDPLASETSHNLADLCRARSILLENTVGPARTVYEYEPLDWVVWGTVFVPPQPTCAATDD